MAEPVTPPIDLLDSTGDWFRFKSFKDYVTALEEAPPTTNAALLVGHGHERPRAPGVHNRIKAAMQAMVD